VTDEELAEIGDVLAEYGHIYEHTAAPLLAEVRRLREEVAALLDDRAHAWRDDCRDTMLLGRLAELTAQRDFAHEKSATRDRLLSERAEEVAALKAEVAAAETRMVEVLRIDPIREVDGTRGIRVLTDLVCGDLIQSRAEVARLAGLAREACENLRHMGTCGVLSGNRCDCYVADLRSAIPAPDPAAFVAAVDAYGEAARRYGVTAGNGEPWERLCADKEKADAARAALLALGGVR